MNPCGGAHVLTHQVNATQKQFDAIEGATAEPGGKSGMGGFSCKFDIHLTLCGRADIKYRGIVERVPMQQGIHVFKEAVTSHIDFSTFGFFSSTAEYPHSAVNLFFLHQVFDGHRRAQGPGTDEVVAASVSRRYTVFAWLFMRNRLVSKLRQGIIFEHNSKNRLSRSVLGNKGGRHAGGAFTDHLKSTLFQFLLEII